MAGSLADLFVKIGADTSDLTNGLKSGLDDAVASLGAFGSAATLVGGAAVAALAAVGAAAFKVGTDFEEATATLRAGTGATGQALEDLKVSAANVFGQVPASIQEVSAAMADLATVTGLTGEPLERLTKQFLDLKDLPAGFSGDVTKLTRVFGDWSVATENQSNTLDFLFKTSQSTAVGVDQLADTVVQFGAPLRQLGFDLEQSVALIGRFGKEGVNTETVFSGLRFALGQFAKAGLDAKDAFAATVQAIKDAESPAEATGIAFKVFGQRAANDMAAAIREGRFEIDEFVGVLNASTETIATADDATETLGEKFSVLGNRVSLLLEPLGSFLVDALTSVVDIISNAFNPAAEGAAGAFASINEFLQPVIQSMTQALGPAFEFISGLAISLGAAIIDLNVQAYAPLLDILGKVAYFIRDVVVFHFEKMAEGIDLIVKGLRLIPGVASLVDSGLEKIGRSAGDVATATAQAEKGITGTAAALTGAGKAATEGGKALGGAAKASSGLKIDFDKLGKSTTDVKEKLDDLPKPMRFVIQTSEDLEKQTVRIRDEWRKLRNEELRDLISDFPIFANSVDDAATAAFQAVNDMNALTGALDLQAYSLSDAELNSINVKNAYEALGITSKDVADKKLNALSAAVGTIRAEVEAGRRPVEDLNAAIGAYNKAAGEGKETTNLWRDSLVQVSTVVTDFGKQFVTDFGAKLNTGIGIIDNMKDSILRLISEKVFGSLLGQFQKLVDFIPGLKDIQGIFGSLAGTAGTAAGGVAGSAGGAAGDGASIPGGGAGGAGEVGGTLGTVTGIVTGIVNAITGVIGVFQNARQENTLNAIEESTRRGTLFLGDRGDGGILGTQFRIAENSDYIVGNTDEMKLSLWNIRDTLQQIAAGALVATALSAPAAGAAQLTFPAITEAIETSRLDVNAGFRGLSAQFNDALALSQEGSEQRSESLAQLNRIANAVENQGPEIVINIENVNGTNQQAVEAFMKEVEKRLRTSTRGIR